MKKLIQIIIILALFAFCYQIVVIFFINDHEKSYSIASLDDRKYTILESYQKEKDDHYYDFFVTSGKDIYSFSINHDFGKQDQVIDDIKYYKSGKVQCIFPIYKRDATAEVSCQLNGNQVSYSYLRQIGNQDIEVIISKLKKEGYDSPQWKDSNKKETVGLISTYPKHMLDDYIFTVWNYKGIYIIRNNKVEKKEFLDMDHYENNLSMISGKYYVTFSTDHVENQLNYRELIIYNLQDGGKTQLELDVELSKNSYFNGASEGLLYITDVDHKKQYTLDPAKKKIREQQEFKVVNNHALVDAGPDFFDRLQVDSLLVENKNITKLYGDVEIKKNRDDYYFKTKDGKLYRIIQNNYKYPILICQFSDIKDWKVKENGVSLLTGDTIYFYSDHNGLKPIIVSNEFKYNYKNIYDFIREE